MDLSVLIPTYRRPRQLAACLQGLSVAARSAGSVEVVVGLDGPDEAAESIAHRAWTEAGGDAGALRVETCPKRGYIDVRHELFPTLRGRWFVSLNDDIRPGPDFLAAHRRAHEELAADGRSAVVVGDSRFVAPDDPTLVDLALDRTGMVFFWDAMDPQQLAGERDRDWGFRHCFGLNFSAERARVADVGGFPSMPETYGYDDIELGYRLAEAGLPILYRPEASAPHDHRYRAADLLRRERSLGIAAVRYARAHPAFARAVFGRDVLAPAEADFAMAWLERERRDLLARRARFLALDRAPAGDIPEGARDTIASLVADHARPVRRACWYEGLIEATTAAPCPSALTVVEPVVETPTESTVGGAKSAA